MIIDVVQKKSFVFILFQNGVIPRTLREQRSKSIRPRWYFLFCLALADSKNNLIFIVGSWRELYQFLSKSPETLIRNAEHLDNVLDTLDPQQHSLGVLAVYVVKFMILNQTGSQVQAVTLPNFDLLLTQVTHFITVCNGEQIRYAPDSCKISWYFNCF